MYVDRLLDVARGRLVTIHEGALLKDAARLLDDRHTGLVIACNAEGIMVGVVSRGGARRGAAARLCARGRVSMRCR